MLKIVVFDSGFGGELFADALEAELPVAEIIRVIDWRNAEKYLESPRLARKTAESAIRPYLKEVNLIIFANHLLSLTSLRYFRRKYKSQLFLGLKLPNPEKLRNSRALILTTSAVTKTINFHNYLFHLKAQTKTLALDTWPPLIDDGELTDSNIAQSLAPLKTFSPDTIILTCSHFCDIKPEIRHAFGHNIKIKDSFQDAIHETFKILKLRGHLRRKKT